MRKLQYIALSLVCAFAAASCNKQPAGPKGFHLEADDIAFSSEGGVGSVKVISDAEWTAVASEPWIMLSPANGIC